MAFLASLLIIFIVCNLAYTQSNLKKDLVVTSLLLRPFLSAINITTDGKEAVVYEGYIKDLVDEVAKLTGISYVFSIRADNKYGHPFPNGSWDGLIGDVVDKRADFAAGPLTESSARSRVVDFSTPFMNFGPVIIMKRPQAPVMTLEERLRRLFSPLSQSIWMLSGLAWLITSAVLYIICYVNPYDWRRLAKDRQATYREGESFSCLNTFWFTMSNILWQGYTRSPRSLGARIVVSFWWAYVLIFVVMYIASMTNYLRVGPTQDIPDYYRTIQKIDDLVRQVDMSYGVIKGGTTEQYLQSSKDEVVRQVWKKINKENTYISSLEKGVEQVRTSRRLPFAVIAESAMAKYFTQQSPCDSYMVGDFTTIGSYSLAFPANSSLVRQVDFALLTMREKGVLKELEDRWFSGDCTGFLVETNTNRMQLPPFHGVDLGSFSGALIILGTGLILGSLTTLVEVFIYKYAEVGEKKKSAYDQEKNTSEQTAKVGPVSRLEPEPITDV